MINIDIYSLEEFELYSDKRDMSFRFITYTGSNYKRLCWFLSKGNDNVKIWSEESLIVGTLYTIDRFFRLSSVHKYDIRFCIINNPYYVSNEQSERIPLAMSEAQAISYLKERYGNCIFGYNPLDSQEAAKLYTYNSHKGRFMLISKDHKRGLSIDSLPQNTEWYIGREDGLSLLRIDFEISQDRHAHTAHLTEKIRAKVDDIVRVIFSINKIQSINKKELIFMPSWEEYNRQLTLYTRFASIERLKDFVQTLYNYIFESTKDDSGVTKARLPSKFRYSEFVGIVGEFRNYFFHGQSEYVPRGEIKIGDIFLRYTGRQEEPIETHDFNDIQIKMLCNFEEFLHEIHFHCKQSVIVEGVILQDDDGYIYCKNILLPDNLFPYIGCECTIVKTALNNNDNNDVYPEFCQSPRIYKTIEGVVTATIMEDGSQRFYCGDILLPAECEDVVGGTIKVPYFNPIYNDTYSPATLSLKTTTYEIVKPGDPTTSGIVKMKMCKDRSILYYCGNVQMSNKVERIVGQEVQICGVIDNKFKESTKFHYFCYDYKIL